MAHLAGERPLPDRFGSQLRDHECGPQRLAAALTAFRELVLLSERVKTSRPAASGAVDLGVASRQPARPPRRQERVLERRPSEVLGVGGQRIVRTLGPCVRTQPITSPTTKSSAASFSWQLACLGGLPPSY